MGKGDIDGTYIVQCKLVYYELKGTVQTYKYK